jgi:hypothetical protein
MDEVRVMLGKLEASRMAGHKSLKVAEDHYLVGEDDRKHAEYKDAVNEFSKTIFVP